MRYKTLLDRGIIKRFTATSAQVESQMSLAKRDLETAAKILDEDSDWAFSIAYNAILQVTRGLLYAEGYRLSGGEGHHKAAIEFAEITLGNDFRDEIRFFDRMRIKRNQAVYDMPGIVSQDEARQAIEFARRFVETISRRLSF
ncbi:MAG: HEPN domain-containing protein [Syntrophales bacterium]